MLYRHSTRQRKGAIIVYAAISMTLLIGLAALAIDIGFKHDRLRHLQAAADASALAGAADMFKRWATNYGADVGTTAYAAAIANATNNGYTTSVNGSTVDVRIPPTTGPNVGKAGYIEVIITKQDNRFFSKMYSSSSLQTQARAVARASFDVIGEGVIVLDLHQKSALNAHGGGIMTLTGNSPFVVNSDHAQAGITNGSEGAQLRAGSFRITGNYTETGSSTFANPDGSTPANIVLSKPPMPDPLAYLPAPDKTTMPAGTSSFVNLGMGAKQYTLTPGVFTGGLSFGSKDSVLMQPGIYYMDHGGFSFSGTGSMVAVGVMIYNYPTSTSQKIDITGQGSVTWTPPLTGLYKGLTVFQDRTADVDINIVGNGNFHITGTFYAANANVKISGNGDSSIGSQYISRTLDIGGNGALTIDYNAAPHPSRRILQLVE